MYNAQKSYGLGQNLDSVADGAHYHVQHIDGLGLPLFQIDFSEQLPLSPLHWLMAGLQALGHVVDVAEAGRHALVDEAHRSRYGIRMFCPPHSDGCGSAPASARGW